MFEIEKTLAGNFLAQKHSRPSPKSLLHFSKPPEDSPATTPPPPPPEGRIYPNF